MYWLNLMISVFITLMTFRQQINPKQNKCSVSKVTSTSAWKGQESAHKSHKVSIPWMTAVNCQPHKTQCLQLFCFNLRKIHRPALMEFLSSKAVMQCLTENEELMVASRWTLPNSLTHHSPVISRLEMWPICPVVGVPIQLPNAKTACQSQVPWETKPKMQCNCGSNFSMPLEFGSLPKP